VLDGLGRPIDGRSLPPLPPWPVDRPAPAPLCRRAVDAPLATGVRAIDALLTLGEGQRVGLFAGSGVGKSSLLGQIARGADADVAVIALVGERGREVRDFVEGCLGAEGLARSVVVAATSDAPPLVRLRAAQVATAIAEWFADVDGCRVLLLLDSVTRFARAQREVALAAGEPPARQGYPPSVFAELPRLLERAGARARGNISAVYTVLVAGGDLDEPIADEVRGILDGHVVLDRRRAERGQFPAIDPLASLSRLMPRLVPGAQLAAALRLRQLVAGLERQRELVALGAYVRGGDPDADAALDRAPAIEAFLRQAPGERSTLAGAAAALQELVA
jgi:type III secretion protein N (ATPase)